MGSFFIPMTVMVYVYVRISCVVASRHDKMTEIVHKVCKEDEGLPCPYLLLIPFLTHHAATSSEY